MQDQNNANPGDPIANYTRIGSGVIIDPRGYALSSLHVVDRCIFPEGHGLRSGEERSEYPLKIVKADQASDLVLLRIQGDGPFPHADLGDSNAVRTGDVVLSIGSPFGFEQSVTSGIISSRNRTLNVGGMVYENLIQTDSSINKGSSGGPLINAKGDVIGINTAIYSPSGVFSGISFAVPINRSLDLIGGVVDFQNQPPPVANGQLAAWRVNARQIGNAYRFPDGQIITPPHNYRGTCASIVIRSCVPRDLCRTTLFRVRGRSRIPGGEREETQPVRGRGLIRFGGPRRNPGPWCPVVGPNNLSLGITVIDVDDVIANQNNMMRPGGVLVNSITPGTAGRCGGTAEGRCHYPGRRQEN